MFSVVHRPKVSYQVRPGSVIHARLFEMTASDSKEHECEVLLASTPSRCFSHPDQGDCQMFNETIEMLTKALISKHQATAPRSIQAVCE